MKKTLSILSLLTVAVCLTSVRASAQDKFYSGFFLDNYSYSYRLNPAIMSEKSFLGIGAGNVEAGINSGLGISSLIYPNEDGTGLVTFLHPSVTTEEMMSHLGQSNAIGADFSVNLFSTGTRRENKFSTFEINLRTDLGTALPGDLFRFLKEGSSANPYDLSSLYAGAKAYAEIAIGTAKKPGDGNLTIGFRIKGLIGLASADIHFDKADIVSNGGVLATNMQGVARMAFPGANFYNDSEGNIQLAFEPANIRPAGYGGAIDIGIKWNPIPSLSVTGGINDLGGIFWKYNSIAKATNQFQFNGFDNVSTDTDFSSELDKAGKSFLEISNLQAMDATESEFERLAFTANLGAKYRIPVVNFISVGALGIYHFDSIAPYWDARAGVTLSPLGFLSVTANYGQNTQGRVLGLAASVTLLFVNVYVGLDTYAEKVGLIPIDGVNIPVYGGVPVPIDPFRCKLNFGLNLQFGTRYRN